MKQILIAVMWIPVTLGILLVWVALGVIYNDQIGDFLERWVTLVTRVLRKFGLKAGAVPIVACVGCGGMNRLVRGAKNARCGRCHELIETRAN